MAICKEVIVSFSVVTAPEMRERGYHRLWGSGHGEPHLLFNSGNTAPDLRPAGTLPGPMGEEGPNFRCGGSLVGMHGPQNTERPEPGKHGCSNKYLPSVI